MQIIKYTSFHFITLLFFFSLLSFQPGLTQNFAIYKNLENDSLQFSVKKAAVSSGLLLSCVGMITLTIDEAYYQDNRVKFHFAKDANGNLTWFDNYHRAMDKFGHGFSTSLFSQNIYFLSRWSGYSNQTSSILASSISIGLLGAMEVWDAHFESWGFSVGDFISNVAGGMYPVLQYNYRPLQNIDYKMSYNFIKKKSADHGIHDYEHMTFWLTVNPRGFSDLKYMQWFPNWLNIAAGIGLDSYQNQKQEFYIGLDYNLKRIKTDSLLLNQLIAFIDRFHFPAPAIRVSPGTVYYGFFF
ncbi:MAG: DUF2279 domain-containing protein [Calditrichaceae bacterium]|nr:DUF2279 domain-containing protein [Calditrichaceae bacterium]